MVEPRDVLQDGSDGWRWGEGRGEIEKMMQDEDGDGRGRGNKCESEWEVSTSCRSQAPSNLSLHLITRRLILFLRNKALPPPSPARFLMLSSVTNAQGSVLALEIT